MKNSLDELAALMRAGSCGDAESYRKALIQLATIVRAIALRGLNRAGRGREDAEDIVQETLLAIHLKRHTWDAQQPLLPWVRAIAHHKLVDALRRRGFSAHVPIEEYEHMLPDVRSEAEFTSSECLEALSLLPERQRMIVMSIAIEGHSAREIANRLGMTESNVRVTLHRSLKALGAAFRQNAL